MQRPSARSRIKCRLSTGQWQKILMPEKWQLLQTEQFTIFLTQSECGLATSAGVLLLKKCQTIWSKASQTNRRRVWWGHLKKKKKKFISLTNVTEIRPLSCSRWSDVGTSHRCSKFHHHGFITSETRGHTGNVATGLQQRSTQELHTPPCDNRTCNCKASFCKDATVLWAGIH